MNLDELRSVQSKERQKDSLQNLRPSFYQEVGEYIADLEDERDRVAEQADDPFSSPEVGRLTDEIETAKDVVEAIYERRMGKLVKQASLSAAGMAANDEGLTAEEADLFDDLVERIGSNKSRVLDVLEEIETEGGPAADTPTEPDRPDSNRSGPAPIDDPGTAVDSDSPAGGVDDDTPPVPPQEPSGDAGPTPPPAADDDGGPETGGSGPSEGPESGDSSGVTPADVMGSDGPTIDEEVAGSATPSSSSDDGQPYAVGDGAGTGTDADIDVTDDTDSVPDPDSNSVDDGSADMDVDRMTVRITRDIGSILGVDDREYSLSTDDIVTLPEQNATPLLEQEAAEPLE
ncbi:hypothetical protein GS429_11905 [Natronorubrum sp. JWXQ-INN-674]|uniref:GINS subunit domain-containing protein n=1 Tax=Natronorubrum halalkaliphilum TaxID=2691917 RepID=A0A6B0VNQ2_9EURY|nr:hypothetical protein [Natronorubrum halalkaliphilum]MXV62757.1 hypothetical protein [Natronorubrum halalkaliphilum]